SRRRHTRCLSDWSSDVCSSDLSVEHNFSIDAQNIDMNVQPGSSAKVTVTIPKSSALSFYCKFHKSMGMAGALAASGSGGMTGTGGGTSTWTTTTKGYGY